jgi:hypothetical protein
MKKDAYKNVQEALDDGRKIRQIPLAPEAISPDDFPDLEKKAREHFNAREAETKPEGKGRNKAKRNQWQKAYARTARRNRTQEQKAKQVAWTRNWRKKCRASGH